MNRIDLPAELRRAEAEIDRWEEYLSEHPGNDGAKRRLGWAEQWARRVRTDLASAGVEPT